jgi:hypothetical protein
LQRAELRRVVRERLVEAERALTHRLSQQVGGENLCDGADLEDRAAGKRLALAHVGEPKREGAGRPIAGDDADADTNRFAVVDARLGRCSHDPGNRVVVGARRLLDARDQST